MTALGILFVLLTSSALLLARRVWAPLPLLFGATYMTLGQNITLGPLHFYVIRILIAVGVMRTLARGERIAGRYNTLDYWMMAWSAWSLFVSVFYNDFAATLVARMGTTYTTLGAYYLLRVFCRDMEDLIRLIKVIAIILAPIALEMLCEQATGYNLFSIFGRVDEAVAIRGSRLRAQGPFAHAILAGTVAAGCIPLFIGIYRAQRKAARLGIAAALLMILACASSGPIMSLLFGLFAFSLWRWRGRMHIFRISAVVLYICLDLVMTRPAYFIIQRFDLTGNSTGWHRAELIRSTIAHFDEWWLAGTHITRHWMPTGIPGNPDQTDITSQYIANAVNGGLILLGLFCGCLYTGFRFVGTIAKSGAACNRLGWALGSSLFAHAASSLSVAYFDQSIFYLYAVLAAISSLRECARPEILYNEGGSPAERENTAFTAAPGFESHWIDAAAAQ